MTDSVKGVHFVQELTSTLSLICYNFYHIDQFFMLKSAKHLKAQNNWAIKLNLVIREPVTNVNEYGYPDLNNH